MSHASLIRTLPETLSQPVGLAALASLGIHGLLWVILPVLPLDSKSEVHSQRTVGLVQLTPEELTRLPQTVTPQPPLPPLALQQNGLPPLPPSPPTLALQPNGLPPLPPPPPYQPNTLPPLPPPPSFNLAPLPGSTATNNYPLKDSLPQPSTVVIPPPPPIQNTQPFSARSPFSKLPIPSVPIPSYRISQPNTPIRPNQAYKIPKLSSPRPFTPPPNRGLPNLALKPSAPFVPDSTPSQTVPYRINQSPTQLQNQPPTQLQNQPPTQLQNQPPTQQNQPVAVNPLVKPPTNSALPDKLPERGKQELLALQQQIRARYNRNQAAPQSDRALPTAKPPAASTPATSTPERPRQEKLAALQQRLQQKQSSEGNQTASTPAANPPQSNRQEKLTALQQRLQQSSEGNQAASTPVANPPQSNRQEKLTALQQRLQQSSQANTTDSVSPQTAQKIAQINEYQERFQQVQQANPKVETKAPIRKNIKTCEKQLDGSAAVFGVVFNPNGKVISGPDFIPQNTTVNIQKAAKDYLSNYQPQKSVSPIDQSFRLEFQYDSSNCAKKAK